MRPVYWRCSGVVGDRGPGSGACWQAVHRSPGGCRPLLVLSRRGGAGGVRGVGLLVAWVGHRGGACGHGAEIIAAPPYGPRPASRALCHQQSDRLAGASAYSVPVSRRSRYRNLILRTARTNPALTAAQIARIVGCSAGTVCKHLGACPAPAVRLTGATDEDRRRCCSSSGAPPAATLARLACDPNVRFLALRHPRCPPRVLTRAAASPTNCDAVAGNHAAAAAAVWRVFSRLSTSQHSNYTIKQLIVTHPHTPSCVLARLVDDEHCTSAVARHPHAPRLLLATLAKAPDLGIDVRQAIASHPNSPPAATAALAGRQPGLLRGAARASRWRRPFCRSGVR